MSKRTQAERAHEEFMEAEIPVMGSRLCAAGGNNTVAATTDPKSRNNTCMGYALFQIIGCT